ncbi:MAG: DHHA1 domain-containing protein [Candidatus Micrarchaeaceae archaeon]
MPIVIISHRSDLDGISSAALIARYAAKYQKLPFYIALKDYADKENIIDDIILGTADSEIFISDLSTNQGNIDKIIARLKILKKNKNKIYWMDHHKTTDLIVNKLKKIVDVLDVRASNFPASQIVYDRVYSKNGIRDSHAKMLAILGTDADLMKLRHKITPKLVSIIDYYNYIDAGSAFYPDLVQLALSIAMPKIASKEDALLDDVRLKEIEYYESLKKAAAKKVLDNVEIFKAGKYSFALFNYPSLFSGSQISVYVLNANNVDASVGFNEHGKGSVRRKNNDIDCAEIASHFGGGGHAFAAGFSLDFITDSASSVKKAKALIRNKLQELY